MRALFYKGTVEFNMDDYEVECCVEEGEFIDEYIE